MQKRSAVHVAGAGTIVAANAPQPTASQAPRVPDACPQGRATWRERSQTAPTSVVNLATWDLCDIGYELANGFLRRTDWSYWTCSQERSWVQERTFYQASETPAMRDADAALMADLVRQADIVHVNEYHNHKALSGAEPGKRMVIHHHGCAFRDNPAQYEDAETRAGYTRIVSTPDLLGCGARKGNLQWLPSPVPLEEYDKNLSVWAPHDPHRVVIGHGYTVGANKGTDDFLRIANRCRAPGLEVAVWHRVQRRLSQWYLSQCDLYFATFAYGPGLATIEAMAMGIPALVGCDPDDLAWQLSALGLTRIRDLPWLYVTRDNLAHALKTLTADAGLRAHWGARGRAYVEQYHAVPAVVAQAKAIYEGTEPCRFVVQP